MYAVPTDHLIFRGWRGGFRNEFDPLYATIYYRLLMKLFETTHHFEYPWEQVTAANWRKYPNELAAHVVLVDVLSRTIDADKQILRTERLIGCKQAIPRWLSYAIGAQESNYVREVSEIDLKNRTLVMKLMNLTLNHFMLVNETVVYKPNQDNPSHSTCFTQVAEITAYASIARICDKIEEWSIKRFQQNAQTGRMAFESVLKVFSEKAACAQD